MTFSRLALLLTVGVLASCGGGGLTSTGGSAGSGSGSGSGGSSGGLQFSMGDLNGDWTGELIPDNRTLIKRNVYIRVANGQLTDSAEGGGGDWDPSNASIQLDFNTQGFLDLAIDSLVDEDMTLEGTMNVALNQINGTVSILRPDGDLFEGTFELRRSSGAGHFSIGLSEGVWQGQGSNSRERFRIAGIEFDRDGVVVEAKVLVPGSLTTVHFYSAGAGTLVFADDAIGRINNVLLASDDGSTLSFEFLLINDAGTLITGPGVDSTLGAGKVELTR
ncbi:MAG: hypothetical protein O3A95_02395 [Planctomycetota bacterium]|nr:hypothetical protein [Planctomycetota bacterium]MDA1113133.1 hypothetical protein [Planctomycetota bacterium]